jgi:YkoY family integral membrane protein
MFGVTPADLFLIGFLAFLEGILSIDNAIVLAMMAKPLPPAQQKKALTYGLVGAVFFRLAVLAIATKIIHWPWAKILGGGYLLFIGLRHFISGDHHEDAAARKLKGPPNFWRTVVMIELMDIAFAVDSILAAVALTDKLWIVFTGGMLGVIMMRYAATVFIKVLAKFPRFERTAYELIILIGMKLLIDAFHLPGIDFHSPSSPGFWAFWGLMALSILLALKRKRG